MEISKGILFVCLFVCFFVRLCVGFLFTLFSGVLIVKYLPAWYSFLIIDVPEGW